MSVVDYLKSQNIDSSFSNRKRLASTYNIPNYKGTAAQNIQLLNILKRKSSGVPSPSKPNKLPKGTVYVDLQKEYGLSPFSKKGIDKALELSASNPGLRYVCDADGCAEIARKAGNAQGYDYPWGRAWDYGNMNKVVYRNPNYKIEDKVENQPLPDPTTYNVPSEIKSGKKGQVVGMNRKNNVVTNDGRVITKNAKNYDRSEYIAQNPDDINDSYDYAGPMYKDSRGYEHLGYIPADGKLLHGTGKTKNHPAYYVITDLNNEQIQLGEYGKYEPVELIQKKGYYDKLKDYFGFKYGGRTKNIINKYEYGGRIGDESFLGRTTNIPKRFVGADVNKKKKQPIHQSKLMPKYALKLGNIPSYNTLGLKVRHAAGGPTSLDETGRSIGTTGKSVGSAGKSIGNTSTSDIGSFLKSQKSKTGYTPGGVTMQNVFNKDNNNTNQTNKTNWIFGTDSQNNNNNNNQFKQNLPIKIERKPTSLITDMPNLKGISSATNQYLENVGGFKSIIGFKESRGDYNAVNKNTGAAGKYQFLPKYFKSEVENVLGISWNEFKTCPSCQERLMDYHIAKTLSPTAEKLAKEFPNSGLSKNQLMALVHFQGPKGARDRLMDPKLFNQRTDINISSADYVSGIK